MKTILLRSVSILAVVTAFAALSFAQEDPLGRLSVETVNTRNFEITMETSSEHRRPTPKEVGVLVERLCAQLDKIFSKYAPQRVADELERQKKEEAEGKKPRASARDREVDETDPDRVIPKCRIFIFNERPQYVAKCLYDGLDAPGEGYSGFFTTKTNSTYMMRSWSLQFTRQTILHETTHYYTFNFLPGGWHCYPEWFHEGLAMTYEKHFWNGDNLVIGVQPRIQSFDAPASGLTGLVRFRNYLKKEAGQPDEEEAPAPAAGRTARRPAKAPETPIDPGLIQPFLDTQFTPEVFHAERITLKDPKEAISHRYAMYQTFGRFLLQARPDHLGAILRQIALWEKDKDKTYPRDRWFVEAWKKAAERKPITVEEVGRWLQKNQLPFKWSSGDWQDIGDEIAGKAQPGKICLLALSNPQALPKFTVFPKNASSFQAGVAINFIDNSNFGIVAVNQDGKVLVMEMKNGSWNGPAKAIGTVGSASVRNHPYDGGPAFQFQLSRQGDMIGVQINRTPFGTYPTSPEGSCGFFLSDTEGIFSY